MTSPGWFPDPCSLHHYRYYDGQTWTEHISDYGVAGIDPVSPPPVPPQTPQPPPPGPSRTTGQSMQQLNAWTEQQMRTAAVWWSNRRRGTPPGTSTEPPVGLPFDAGAPEPQLLSDTEAPTLLGQWSGLADAVSHYALASAGVAASGDLIGMLHAITGAADAQTRLLQRIDAKLDALVFGPYQTGRTHLGEAARVGADDPTQLEHIKQAKDCFYLAQGQAASVQSRALVEYHLAMTWLLLNRNSDAKHWFACSYASALAVVNELARQTHDVRVLQSRKTTAAASYFYPAGVVVLGMKFKKMLAAEQAGDMLREYLPFLACTARSHNTLAEPEAAVPALQLTTGEAGHELVEVPV